MYLLHPCQRPEATVLIHGAHGFQKPCAIAFEVGVGVVPGLSEVQLTGKPNRPVVKSKAILKHRIEFAISVPKV